eukprot:8672765-Karenia_brevis.AAC.1
MCDRCQLGVCNDCAHPCAYCGLDFDYLCEFIHSLGCPQRWGIEDPSEPYLTSYMASKDAEGDSTEFHFIGDE